MQRALLRLNAFRSSMGKLQFLEEKVREASQIKVGSKKKTKEPCRHEKEKIDWSNETLPDSDSQTGQQKRYGERTPFPKKKNQKE